jgi:hypothetical protein
MDHIVAIGILQPNFDPNPETMIKYEGTVLLKYLQSEEHNGQPCRKYDVGGEGLKGCFGTMWVNIEKRMIEDLELPIADNPDTDTFKFKFVMSEQMTPQQWEEFTESEIKQLKT